MQRILLVCAIVGIAFSAHSILDFGAIEERTETEIAFANAESFRQAVLAANASATDKVALIPAGHRFWMMATFLEHIHNVEIVVDGTAVLSEDFKNWPYRNDTTHEDDASGCLDFWTIYDSQNITIRGHGKVDGLGYSWWWREYFQKNVCGRPHQLYMKRVRNVLIEEVRWVNSPRYHLMIKDGDSIVFRNFEIFVDVFKQEELATQNGFWDYDLGIPTFPLNTDGIDPSATNVLIKNVTITNFDDAVAVKPAHNDDTISKCAQYILVEDCTVYFSVGMTIGSVPPRETYACIKDVTFRNIKMILPIKAVYVKTNPGDKGSGIIANILYENFEAHFPIWWGIYIGPQQQKQPDGSGPGCMFYPLGPCETQPRITVQNITLRNMEFEHSLLTPGIIRCNETNPCTGFTFDNVHMNAWYTDTDHGFITENVYGTVIDSYPDPGFLSPASGPAKQSLWKKIPKRSDFKNFFQNLING